MEPHESQGAILFSEAQPPISQSIENPSPNPNLEGLDLSVAQTPTDQSKEVKEIPVPDQGREDASASCETDSEKASDLVPGFTTASTFSIDETSEEGVRDMDDAPSAFAEVDGEAPGLELVAAPSTLAEEDGEASALVPGVAGFEEAPQDMDDALLVAVPSVASSAFAEVVGEAPALESVQDMDDAALVAAPSVATSVFAEADRETSVLGSIPDMDDAALVAAPSIAASSSAEEHGEAAASEAAGFEEGPREMDGGQQLASSSLFSEEDGEEGPQEFEPARASGSPVAVAGGDEDEVDDDQMDMEESEEHMTLRGRRGRRKRGRPPKVQATKALAKKRKEPEKGDEEVCFICFDGGDLVLCDRKGCPKVYHPSCVNRDEAFFRAKGRWNCGWHICSNCQKSAQYMCYTCTFSLCKVCLNEAGFTRVRENKGFCVTCMSTVIMIESSEDGSKKTGEIDFDDRSSWMYLFKDYWLDLKGKLSLTLEELTRARTPRKDSNAISRAESSEDLYTMQDVEGPSSDSSSGRFELRVSSKKKAKKRTRKIINEERSVKEAESEGASISEDVGWASKELLELVAHMKGGDESALSRIEVQDLVLEYIKLNNLRDPRAKSQVICDPRLQNLFGKTRVGHFEMLKLIESHVFTKVPSPVVTDDNQGGVLDPEPSQMDTEGNSDASTRMSLGRRRRTRKRLQEREEQTNLDDYAAIDVHNVTLLYLRRSLMEDMIDDIETFSEKVVGTFVRIRIPGATQKQDMYRLVQVVGLGKAENKYRIGKKSTDFTLELSNLNKIDFMTIDVISNQEFTEEECKRLRQSIKCGFIDRLTVGEVQEKARVLQPVRIKDWLESEKLRLGNLRDRASEKGRRKELRECIEKLQLLSTPEEHTRLLKEIPEVHADPKMDPDYESSEDEERLVDKRHDYPDHSRESFFPRRANDVISSGKGGSLPSSNWNSPRKSANTNWEPKRNNNTQEESSWDIGSSTSGGNRTNQPFFGLREPVHQMGNSQGLSTITKAADLEAGASSSKTSAVVPVEPTPAPSKPSETEKMWHYKDPSGKVQGPFSMTKLRKWSTTGHFPTGMGIWRASEREEDSILLTDALSGKFQKELPQVPPHHNTTTQPAKVATMADPQGSKTDRWAAHSSTGSAPTPEAANRNERRVGISSNNVVSGQPQGLNSPRGVPPFHGNPHRPSSYQGRGGGRGRWNGGQDRQNSWNQNRNRGAQHGNQGYERHSNWNNSRQQPPRGPLNSQQGNNTSNQVRHDSFNMPTQQSSWMNAQVPFNGFPPTVPVQMANSGWGVAAQTVNSVGGGGPSSTQAIMQAPSASAPVPNTAMVPETAYSSQIPSQLSDEQRKPSDPGAPSIPARPSETINQNGEKAASSNPDAVESVSAQAPEISSHQKQERDVLSANPPPTPPTMPSAPGAGAGPNTGNSQNIPVMLPGRSQPSTSFHGNAPTASEAPQPSYSGLGAVVPENPSMATVPVQANSSMMWGGAVQGAGWGAVTQGNMNVVWGIPAQGNANMGIGWGTPVQANPGASTGWAAPPAQGDVSANMVWGAPPTQGNVTQNASWQAASAQGNINHIAGWQAAPVQGNVVQAASWQAAPPAQGNVVQTTNWQAAAVQGNMVPNPGAGPTLGNMNQNNSWGMPPHQGNANASSGWAPPGQGSTNHNGQSGVCPFHRNGHCKKGAYCNLIHQ